ncbi:MAG: ASCH domain-containing protein [bacterium]
MKALTLWQPWASLVAIGIKQYEFRRWPAPRAFVGERIVIHAAKRPVDPAEIGALLNDRERLAGSLGTFDPAEITFARDYIEGQDGIFPLGCGLAEATVGTPRRAIDLFRAHMDPDEIDPDMWAWPMEAVEEFRKPVPARGAQGFWDWQKGVEAAEPAADLFSRGAP